MNIRKYEMLEEIQSIKLSFLAYLRVLPSYSVMYFYTMMSYLFLFAFKFVFSAIRMKMAHDKKNGSVNFESYIF